MQYEYWLLVLVLAAAVDATAVDATAATAVDATADDAASTTADDAATCFVLLVLKKVLNHAIAWFNIPFMWIID